MKLWSFYKLDAIGATIRGSHSLYRVVAEGECHLTKNLGMKMLLHAINHVLNSRLQNLAFEA